MPASSSPRRVEKACKQTETLLLSGWLVTNSSSQRERLFFSISQKRRVIVREFVGKLNERAPEIDQSNQWDMHLLKIPWLSVKMIERLETCSRARRDRYKLSTAELGPRAI